MKYYSLFNVFCYLVLMLCLSSCGQSGSDTSNFKSDTKRYRQKGLEVIYPIDWLLEDDSKDLVFESNSIALIAPGADRRLVFETPDVSAIFIYFYKSNPQNYLDSANDFINENSLEGNKDVSDFSREMISVLGYKGVKLNWVKDGIGGPLKSELTIFQYKTEPYPVLVEFYFFGEDIIHQNTNIIPFLEGISFDPDGVML